MAEVKIIIEKEIIAIYRNYYFEKYPRRKVFAIEIFPPSLNRFITMKRMAQNNIKQKYKEFGEWLAEYYKIANLNLKKVRMIYSFYFADHRRRDADNLMLVPKFYHDSFVDAKVFIDDSGDILELEFESFKYDKGRPRIEIVMRY